MTSPSLRLSKIGTPTVPALVTAGTVSMFHAGKTLRLVLCPVRTQGVSQEGSACDDPRGGVRLAWGGTRGASLPGPGRKGARALLIRHQSQTCWGGRRGEPGLPRLVPRGPAPHPVRPRQPALLKLGFHTRRAFNMSGWKHPSLSKSVPSPGCASPLEALPGWAEGDFKASLSTQPPVEGTAHSTQRWGEWRQVHTPPVQRCIQEQWRQADAPDVRPHRGRGGLCPALGAPGPAQKGTPELAGGWQDLEWVREIRDLGRPLTQLQRGPGSWDSHSRLSATVGVESTLGCRTEPPTQRLHTDMVSDGSALQKASVVSPGENQGAGRARALGVPGEDPCPALSSCLGCWPHSASSRQQHSLSDPVLPSAPPFLCLPLPR
ncbi:uncharacterized protein LOC131423417 [Marmota monax]|uniref:uncharacterized protein LOC131423417 n=1 Tax=Marmota monax TaxID=9995 RepID=UPI0026ECD170|nr:uncharacterized protein LOC131423417 [Marmota monax]